MKSMIRSVERIWRHGVVYPLLRVLLQNRLVRLPLDLSEIRSILILRYDKIGDMVVTLPVFRILKSRNPHLRLGVLASKVNAEVVVGNKDIDDLYTLPGRPFAVLRFLWQVRKQRYDVVLDFIFNRMSSGGLVCNLACANAVKVGMGPDKYQFYFNALLSIPRGSMPMTEMLIEFVSQVFGLSVLEEERKLRLEIESSVRAKVDRFLKRHRLTRKGERLEESKYIVFNISARQSNKRLSEGQVFCIMSFLGRRLELRTVVIFAPEDEPIARNAVAKSESLNSLAFPDSGHASLMETASLIEGSVAVVTPDTAIVHIASAVSTPVLGIFTPLQVTQEWLPYKVFYKLIIGPEGKPVSAIASSALERGLEEFLGHLQEK